MDIEKLFDIVKKANKVKGEKCLICHFANQTNMIKLNCGHHYHKQCLGPKKRIKCLYCGKITLLKSKAKPKKKEKEKEGHICTAILKSGKRKGEVCGRFNCGYHKNILITV